MYPFPNCLVPCIVVSSSVTGSQPLVPSHPPKEKAQSCLNDTPDTTTYQKVVSNRLLRRHALVILRRRLEDAIPPARRRPLLLGQGHGFEPRRHRPTISSTPTPTRIPITPRHDPTITRVLAQLQNSRHVAAAIAVVWRRPHRHDARVEHLLEALHDELVRARHEREVVVVVEALHDVGAEEEAGAARGEAPAVDLVRVAPEKVAHGAFVGHFLLAV